MSRFCVSDHTIKYYTKFSSQEVFQVFWESVCPSASNLVYWTKAQRMGQEASPSPSPARKIQLIDELFMYSCRVAAGLREQVIADIFGVSVATVSRAIITWANYLFLVLGSVPIWMSRQQICLRSTVCSVQTCESSWIAQKSAVKAPHLLHSTQRSSPATRALQHLKVWLE